MVPGRSSSWRVIVERDDHAFVLTIQRFQPL
jgi:hypothetical protein